MSDQDDRLAAAKVLVAELRTMANGPQKRRTPEVLGDLADRLDLAIWGPIVVVYPRVQASWTP